MAGDDDAFLDVLQNIEFGLKNEYEKNENLTDKKTISALENAKVAVKQAFGYAKNEKFFMDDDTKKIIELCIYVGKERVGKTDNLTLKEYVSKIDKIKRSVERHTSDRSRDYYDFIRNYV